MKVGLVSYHKEPNYGTMLQAYALAEAVRSFGVDCEYLNYVNADKRPYLVTRFLNAARFLYRLFKKTEKGEFDFFFEPPFENTRNAFREFHDRHIPTSRRLYYANDVNEANDDYSFFIVGSDQTWSRYMNRMPRTINFLRFVEDDSRKRSYAPSIGTLHIEESYGKRLGTELAAFGYLSCRERPNCDLLKSLLGRDVQYVLDPTLLLRPADWNKLVNEPLIKDGYILAYILGTKSCISDFAEALGREKGLPVYYVVTRPDYLSKKRLLLDIGPSDFVGLIRDASYVVTDSFHGTLFSINYNVNFYSFAKRSVAKDALTYDNDRISSFLEELGIAHRFKDDHDSGFDEDVDFDKVNQRLEPLRRQSLDYLKNMLNG